MIMRKPLQTRENGVNWEQQKAAPAGKREPDLQDCSGVKMAVVKGIG